MAADYCHSWIGSNGRLIIGSVGLIRIYSLQRQLNRLQSSYQQLEAETDVLKVEKDDSSNISNQS